MPQYSNFENNFPTHSLWQWTVWKANDIPRQIIAPAKKVPNTNFSSNWISIGGCVRKNIAIPIKATHPVKNKIILGTELITKNYTWKNMLHINLFLKTHIKLFDKNAHSELFDKKRYT